MLGWVFWLASPFFWAWPRHKVVRTHPFTAFTHTQLGKVWPNNCKPKLENMKSDKKHTLNVMQVILHFNNGFDDVVWVEVIIQIANAFRKMTNIYSLHLSSVSICLTPNLQVGIVYFQSIGGGTLIRKCLGTFLFLQCFYCSNYITSIYLADW